LDFKALDQNFLHNLMRSRCPTFARSDTPHVIGIDAAQTSKRRFFVALKQRVHFAYEDYRIDGKFCARVIFSALWHQILKYTSFYSVLVVRSSCAVVKVMRIAAAFVVAPMTNVTAFRWLVAVVQSKRNTIRRHWVSLQSAVANHGVTVLGRSRLIPQPATGFVRCFVNPSPKALRCVSCEGLLVGLTHTLVTLTNTRTMVNTNTL
jgi:hypothetical protein